MIVSLLNLTCIRFYKRSVHCLFVVSKNKIFHILKHNNAILRFLSNMSSLETLNFDNLALRRLPLDPEERNYVRTVNAACFSRVQPTPVENPKLVAYSLSALQLLDLSDNDVQQGDFVEYFSGNKLLPGSEPAAHCYCGHQFGYFSGQLGDGAAMYLGEVINKKGERWEIQLKGAGLTPYSRTADGRKVLRSSIREFLCSEAMHFLGIPTTRAGVCITSDSEVIRDMFYDGHPKKEKCSIILRISPTFLRFGSFEIFKTLDPITRKCGPSVGRHEILINLLDYIIEVFYPEIHGAYQSDQDRYAAFFKEIVLRTARLVAEWQCVGFCHGVLNTDNMSIIGVTIDYGPFGFMDIYNSEHICNTSDDGGRYSYRKQPSMCLWNLKKLAEAIEKVLPMDVSLAALELYEPEFQAHYVNKMRKKLGLKKEEDKDGELVEALLDAMQNTGADFTNTFRCLKMLKVPGHPDHESSFDLLRRKLIEQCYPLSVIINSYKAFHDKGSLLLFLKLSEENPRFADNLARSGMDVNHIRLQLEKISALENMSQESKQQQDFTIWTKWLEMYRDRLDREKCEDTTAETIQAFQAEREIIMKNNNPRFILRNYIAQNAIDKAEKGDYSEVMHVLKLLEHPFEDSENLDSLTEALQFTTMNSLDDSASSGSSPKSFVKQLTEYDKLPPEWAFGLKVS